MIKDKKNIYIKTFGCQMNEYDSNRIYDSVSKLGFVKTINQSNADCYILNTCHIRDKAKEKVYHEIGRVKKLYRDKIKPIMVVAGCVAQAENEEMIKREPYIDIILGPQSYHKVNDLLKNHIVSLKQEETEFDTISKFGYFDKIKNNNDKISAFLTIQEGCDKFCKFCVVPYTRGSEFSRSLKELISEANQLVENGAREITLLGQNVNAYNFETKRLSDLILEISKIKDLKRIRYTTSHPIDFKDDLVEVHKNCEKLMPFIHLPVQSGSNKILKEMNRKHNIKQYLKVIEKLKKVKPNIEFSSDFIIGYPGESYDDFKKTIELMNKVKFINSYSFVYSARPGTPAYSLENINHSDAKKRLMEFQNIAEKIKSKYRNQLVNKISTVLFENKTKIENKYFGRDEYFNSVIVKSEIDLVGKIKNVKVLEINQNTLFGEVISNFDQKDYAA